MRIRLYTNRRPPLQQPNKSPARVHQQQHDSSGRDARRRSRAQQGRILHADAAHIIVVEERRAESCIMFLTHVVTLLMNQKKCDFFNRGLCDETRAHRNTVGIYESPASAWIIIIVICSQARVRQIVKKAFFYQGAWVVHRVLNEENRRIDLGELGWASASRREQSTNLAWISTNDGGQRVDWNTNRRRSDNIRGGAGACKSSQRHEAPRPPQTAQLRHCSHLRSSVKVKQPIKRHSLATKT